jgi:molybdopterin-guanine dinucleotide biosynthesis protein A
MGHDKALVRLAGKPLISYALEALRQAGTAASIAGGSSALAELAPQVEDSKSGMGPLGGICSALAATSARLAVFLPVDLPLLPSSLIAALLNHARITGSAVTVASVCGFAQTFPSVLDRAVLPVLETELGAGRGGCYAAFQTAAASLGERMAVLPAEMLVQVGQIETSAAAPAARWFLNVNTPQGLERARTYLARAESRNLNPRR